MCSHADEAVCTDVICFTVLSQKAAPVRCSRLSQRRVPERLTFAG